MDTWNLAVLPKKWQFLAKWHKKTQKSHLNSHNSATIGPIWFLDVRILSRDVKESYW